MTNLECKNKHCLRRLLIFDKRGFNLLKEKENRSFFRFRRSLFISLIPQIFERFNSPGAKRRVNRCQQTQSESGERDQQNVRRRRAQRNVTERVNFRRKADEAEIIACRAAEQTDGDAEKNPRKTQKNAFEQKNHH